ncbi:MAG: glycosyltransferase [Crocinitomicaceae bacterium]|nr:glycosyltransferase [Crocinitomicaceae bacterium]
MKKIKVLRIINRFNLGGPTYNVTFLSRFMSEEFETLLVGGVPDEYETDSLHIPESYGLHPIIIPELKRAINYKEDKKALKKLREIIREFKPDVVHTHASKAGALGRQAAIKENVPVILHTFHGHVFHSYFGKLKTTFYKTVERRLAKKSTRIICISNKQKEEIGSIHKICPPEKIEVIPLGFDLEKFHANKDENRKNVRAKYQLKENEIAIAIIGRLAPVKDHDFFLNVIENLPKESITKIKVFVVGDGELKSEIEEKTNELNSKFGEKRVIMTSWINNIDEFNAGMDIICLTSKNEGTPVSLIEAQASGTPVISTNVGGVQDIIDEGKTGYIIEKGDLNSYVNKLNEMIQDEKMLENMSQNGWNYVKDKFSYARLCADMEKLYKKLLAE